jgi:opacity protein-like surface antigen
MRNTLNYLIVIFLTTSLLFVCKTESKAQNITQDVVYLKNGSVLHGKITEIKVNESITLESNCNDTWVLNQSDIDRIVKEEIPETKVLENKNKTTIDYKRKGFYSNIGISFMFGGGDMDTPFPPIGLRFISGYQFDFGLAIGAGLGIDLMSEVYMPIVGDLKYTFQSSKISPFVYFQGGYSISLENPDPYDYEYYDYYESDLESKGGYILNPGIGFKINLNDRNAVSFAIGYKYSEMNHTYNEYNGQTIDRKIKSNRIILGFGYYF